MAPDPSKSRPLNRTVQPIALASSAEEGDGTNLSVDCLSDADSSSLGGEEELSAGEDLSLASSPPFVEPTVSFDDSLRESSCGLPTKIACEPLGSQARFVAIKMIAATESNPGNMVRQFFI